jgi:heterodisulfide reductase subunit A-like polyferredoxin
MGAAGSGSALVVGGGIGGIQASLDMAAAGYRVYLVEKSPTIGGTMARIDKTFPTNDCSMCIMSPKLVDCARHLNITLLTCSQVEAVSGRPGNFRVRVRRRARYVDEEKCTGCGECVQDCPVERESEFDGGLSRRKAVYRPFPQAAPNVFTIEKQGVSPCTAACPAGCNAHAYVALIRKREFDAALAVIRERIPIPAICGRVCGFCEDACNRACVDEAIQIRALKRFAADYEAASNREAPLEALPGAEPGREKVAVIGSGPAGITAAYDLARLGYRPVVLEARELAGGVLRYGIPEYRLPAAVLDRELAILQRSGLEIRTNTPLGKNLGRKELADQGFAAVFLATGASAGRPLRIAGEELAGVVPGLDFLRALSDGTAARMVEGKTVAVIGGGNTAVDAVRASLRLGARRAMIVYRRSRRQMPVSPEELAAAEAEGAEIYFLLGPERIDGHDGRVRSLVCRRMRLGPPEADGRRRPQPVAGESAAFEVDVVIPALGQALESSSLESAFDGLEVEGGLIRVDPLTLETSLPGVFAGGDAAGSGGYVVHAVAHGHAAAESIHRYLRGRDLRSGREPQVTAAAAPPSRFVPRLTRVPVPAVEPKIRVASFREVETGFTEKQAVAEAGRCLDCGVCCGCRRCVAACKAEAIDHDMQDEIRHLDVGAIVVAAGCRTYDPRPLTRLGHGRYPDVITSIQFERILSASGPTSGHVRRVSDGGRPGKIAFLQCVGSRDVRLGNRHCSSVCCMVALKEAVIAREHEPGIEATIFYMDLRTPGKDFDKYARRAQDEYGVRLRRARVTEVRQEPRSPRLNLLFENESGRPEREDFDLVVLSVGFEGGEDLRSLAGSLGLPLNKSGFIASETFSPVSSRRPGIYVCGPAQEPKDIPETVVQAGAAAAAAGELLAPFRYSEVEAKVYPEERNIAGEPPRVGVFVCHCGINIGGVVDVPGLAAYARGLPYVRYAEDNLYTCSQDTQAHIRQMIGEHALNRVVVASCTPRTHEPLFQETIREVGLNRHLFEMANIRDQCSWVHMREKKAAGAKARDLVRMAVAKATLTEPIAAIPIAVTPRALVVGGGLAGLTACLSVAEQGFEVCLVEKSAHLGGLAARIEVALNGRPANRHVEELIRRLEANGRVRILTDSRLTAVDGFVGNFVSRLERRSGGRTEELEIEHGVAILATGAVESRPRQYLYGQSERVVSLLELAERMNDAGFLAGAPGRVVFIQCVGSREAEHLYCSRVCCAAAVTKAIRLKQASPDTDITLLYRDIRTTGLGERYYTRARELGIRFIRYSEEAGPRVTETGDALAVEVFDGLLAAPVRLAADLLVLSCRIDPNPDNQELSRLFKVALNAESFFLEAHAKLRPVEFATEGVFVCGLAHYPKTMGESICQALAAAGKAAAVLARKTLDVEGKIAAVNTARCLGCGDCEQVCAYGAVSVDAGLGAAVVNEALCKGCGACAAACRCSAINVRGFKDEQILKMLCAVQEV